MRRFFAVVLCWMLWAVLADTVGEAFAAQKLIGQSCSSDNSALDWDAIAQCNGTTFIKGPLLLGAVAVPPYAATSCSSALAGTVQWTGAAFQGCDGSSWKSLTGATATTTFGSNAALYTATGTWTPPSNVSPANPLTVRVLVVGAGAGSGASMSGGGSGYVAASQLSITSTASVAVNVAPAVGSSTNGGSSSFGAYLTATGGYSAGSGGSGGGGCRVVLSSTSGTGGAGGSNGAAGATASNHSCGYAGTGQGTSIVSSSTTVRGIVFQSATFAAGAGGAGSTAYSGPSSSDYYFWGGGGGGGILINGGGPSGETGGGNGGGGGGIRRRWWLGPFV